MSYQRSVQRFTLRLAGGLAALAFAACSDQPDVLPTSPSRLSITAAPSLTTGQVEAILPLERLLDMPEGIAIDHRGNVYVGNRRLSGDGRAAQIFEITPNGIVTRLQFPALDIPNDAISGLTGLAVDH